MARSIPEWIGESDNAAIPRRVVLRVFERYGGVCPACSRKLRRGHWALDHITALINGGKHRETNLQPLCTTPCHSLKTRADVEEKARSYARRASHAGVKRKSRPMLGSKASGWKRKMDGTVVRR